MRISIAVLTIIFLTTIFIFPQDIQAQTEISKEDLIDMTRNVIPVTRSTETIGTPYLYEEFKDGVVTLKDGNITESLSMNFNVYENRVEYADGRSILAFNGDEISSFEIQDGPDKVIFKKGFEANGLKQDEFVQVLSEGPAIGLLKHEVSFQQNVPTYGSAVQRDEYITNQRLFIYENGETERIRRMNERGITRSLDADREELRNFISENNLDVTRALDLQLLFEFYNQIK